MKVLITSLLLAVSLSASANKLPLMHYATGEQLLEACVNASSSLDRGNCWGYLSAFVEVTALMSQNDAINPTFCLGANTTLSQYQRVVVRYGAANPEFLHLGAAFLVSLAFEQEFPCP